MIVQEIKFSNVFAGKFVFLSWLIRNCLWRVFPSLAITGRSEKRTTRAMGPTRFRRKMDMVSFTSGVQDCLFNVLFHCDKHDDDDARFLTFRKRLSTIDWKIFKTCSVSARNRMRLSPEYRVFTGHRSGSFHGPRVENVADVANSLRFYTPHMTIMLSAYKKCTANAVQVKVIIISVAIRSRIITRRPPRTCVCQYTVTAYHTLVIGETRSISRQNEPFRIWKRRKVESIKTNVPFSRSGRPNRLRRKCVWKFVGRPSAFPTPLGKHDIPLYRA